MVDRIREMNERQGSSLAARRSPAHGAVLRGCALSLALAATGCGQKGPLYLPSQAGTVATPASAPASAAVPLAPVQGASSPGLPPAAK
jgi:predicted small lipoprotein YifL